MTTRECKRLTERHLALTLRVTKFQVRLLVGLLTNRRNVYSTIHEEDNLVEIIINMFVSAACKVFRLKSVVVSRQVLKPQLITRSIATTGHHTKEEKPVQLIHLEGENSGVAVIALNRAQSKNAISQQFLHLFGDIMDSIKHDKNIRTVILRSLVPGIFCAGADLKERAKMVNSK